MVSAVGGKTDFTIGIPQRWKVCFSGNLAILFPDSKQVWTI